ncbi:MAG: 2OG-Fe(II) oxygenase [Magnetococcales bacterium]|nr:2OG-Fe(II) oxygenase [Magnetococcales bacterium]
MTQDCLDLDVIRTTPLASEPFRFALWKEAIPPVKAQHLTDHFPEEGFVRHRREQGGDKTYSFLVRKAVEKNRPLESCSTLDPAWQALIKALTGPEYRRVVGEKIGENIDDYPIDVGFFVFSAGNDISIHTDHLTKAATNVLYFGHRWEPEWGGLLQLYRRRGDDFEPFHELPPVTGNGMLLVPSDDSWHGVSPVSATAPLLRRTLQIETWRPQGAVREQR